MGQGEGAPVFRLHHVRVATERGSMELPPASVHALLERLDRVAGAHEIIDAFHAAGAARPVKLDKRSNVVLLVDTITDWGHFVGAMRLPAGLWNLRNTLANDMRGATEDQWGGHPAGMTES